MKKINILCIAILMCYLLVSCSEKKVEERNVTTDFEGVINYSYYFNEAGMLICNKDRLMYSDWQDVEFNYVCTNPICEHTADDCTAITLSEAERENGKDTFVIEYGGKLIIFEKSVSYETELVDTDKIRSTEKYYTNVYEAELDGSNRKHKLSMEGATLSDLMTSGVIVVGGQAWLGGPKECVTVTTYTTDSLGNEDVDTTYEYKDAVYCVDLVEYTVNEYATIEDNTSINHSIQFSVYDNHLYYIKKASSANKTFIGHIDLLTRTNNQLLEIESDAYQIGALGNCFIYENESKIEYIDLTKPKETKVLDIPNTELGVIADVVGDKLAVLTSYTKINDAYEIEYTFYDEEFNEVEKHTYNDYFIFWENIGDRIIYVKPFAKQQMWYKETDDLDDLLEGATYIGSFLGTEHDTID